MTRLILSIVSLSYFGTVTRAAWSPVLCHVLDGFVSRYFVFFFVISAAFRS